MKEISKEEIKEVNDQFSNFINKAVDEFMKDSPLWMRLNFIYNKLNSVLNEKGEEVTANINWDKINNIIHNNLDKYDYNIIPKEIKSIEELANLRGDLIAADCDFGPWQSHICKDCKEEFMMNKREVMFFKNKELQLPKRCFECRKKRRK